MIYFLDGNKLYAYDNEQSGLCVKYENAMWKLSDRNYGDLVTDDEVQTISKNDMLERTNHNEPSSFIMAYLNKYQIKGE